MEKSEAAKAGDLKTHLKGKEAICRPNCSGSRLQGRVGHFSDCLQLLQRGRWGHSDPAEEGGEATERRGRWPADPELRKLSGSPSPSVTWQISGNSGESALGREGHLRGIEHLQRLERGRPGRPAWDTSGASE